MERHIRRQILPRESGRQGISRTTEQSDTNTYDSHIAPASNDPVYHAMRDFEGIVRDMPCASCYITAMHAGLEFQNGSVASTDAGL